MSKTPRGGGGGIFFGGGVDHIHLFWGECIWKSTNLGGVSLNFTRIWGGSAFFIEKMPKWGGVSTFFIKYGLIIEKICKYFAFFRGGVRKFFSKKFLPWRRFGGGVHWVTEFWGGSRWDRQKMGGGSIWRPKGVKLVHPPPGMFMTPSLTK